VFFVRFRRASNENKNVIKIGRTLRSFAVKRIRHILGPESYKLLSAYTTKIIIIVLLSRRPPSSSRKDRSVSSPVPRPSDIVSADTSCYRERVVEKKKTKKKYCKKTTTPQQIPSGKNSLRIRCLRFFIEPVTPTPRNLRLRRNS